MNISSLFADDLFGLSLLFISTIFKFLYRVIPVYSCGYKSIRSKCMILFTQPLRAGYDTRSIFKRSLTGFNSEFSFS